MFVDEREYMTEDEIRRCNGYPCPRYRFVIGAILTIVFISVFILTAFIYDLV